MSASAKQEAAAQVTKEQVAEHSSPESTWIILHGRAYDITNFMQEHPGGPDILKTVAGRDATEEFEDTFHSKVAREQLAQFYNGDVQGMEQTDVFKVQSSGFSAGGANKGTSPVLVMAVLAVVAAVVYKFVL
jgi:cytochrome b involved in lipid metabolism